MMSCVEAYDQGQPIPKPVISAPLHTQGHVETGFLHHLEAGGISKR